MAARSRYAGHPVDELAFVDPQTRTVDWLGLERGESRPVKRSRLITLRPADLAERIDWPSTDASSGRR